MGISPIAAIRSRVGKIATLMPPKESAICSQSASAALIAATTAFDAREGAIGKRLEQTHKAVAAAAATSLAGLGVKIRFMEQDIKYGLSNYTHKLAASTVADCEQLATERAA